MTATVPSCGFLKEEGEPPELVHCEQQATCVALVTELGEYLPACDECAAGRQVKRPQGDG